MMNRCSFSKTVSVLVRMLLIVLWRSSRTIDPRQIVVLKHQYAQTDTWGAPLELQIQSASPITNAQYHAQNNIVKHFEVHPIVHDKVDYLWSNFNHFRHIQNKRDFRCSE